MDTRVKNVDAQPVRVVKRGERIPVQSEENGYFQCWYPIALTSEVPQGTVVGRDFLNGRVVVYRGDSGEAQVMSAYCRHLGADLSLATVVGDDLRCVYHHWSYDGTGQCVKTAAGDEPPRSARLFRFPTAEKWGIIWAFNGESPLYEVPDLGVDEMDLVVRAKEKEVLPVEPYVPFSNALDLQHLRVIHQLEVVRLPEKFDDSGHKIHYDVEFIAPMLGKSLQSVTMYGANCIVLNQKFMNRTVYMMSCGRIVPGGSTVIYNIVATPKSKGSPGEDQMVEQVLKAAEAFGDRLQYEDRDVMHTMSFRQDCLSASDKFMGAYLRFTSSFPRSSIACDMVGR